MSGPTLATHAESTSAAEPTTASGWRAHPAVLAVLAGLTSIAISSVDLGSRQMWRDEFSTVYAIHDLSFHDYLRLISHVDLVHAFFYLLMRPYADVFGVSPAVLRAPSVVGMALAAAGLVFLGRRLACLPVGVIAAGLFVLTPGVSRYAIEAREYGIVTGLVVMSFLALLRAIDRATFWRWTIYVLVMIAIALLNALALAIVPVHLALIWTRARRVPVRLRPLVMAYAVMAVIAIPFYLLCSHQAGSANWIAAQYGWGSIESYFPDLVKSRTGAVALVALAVAGLVIARTKRSTAQPGTTAVLVFWIFVPPLLLVIASVIQPIFFYRYLLYTLPGLCLAAALAIRYAMALLRQPATAALIAVAAVAAFGCLTVRGQEYVRRSPVPGQPNYGVAASVLRQQGKPGDAIVYPFRSGQNDAARRAMTFELNPGTYARFDDVLLKVPSRDLGLFASTERTDYAAALAGQRRVWLIEDVDTRAQESTGLAAALASGYHVAYERKAYYMTVILYVANGTS